MSLISTGYVQHRNKTMIRLFHSVISEGPEGSPLTESTFVLYIILPILGVSYLDFFLSNI